MTFAQRTNTLLMVRPFVVNSNPETADDNSFQQTTNLSVELLTERGQLEFDTMVEKLRAKGVKVVVDDTMAESGSVDAHFPNNWISFHENGKVAIYPMLAVSRRLERRDAVLEAVESEFHIETIVDYSQAEDDDVFLEGTGSMVLDRKNRLAYAALSERTDEDLFIEFCEDFEYFPIPFRANTSSGDVKTPIYHTNVMMSIADDFVVICASCISEKKERKGVLRHLRESGLEVILITEAQMRQFAGNVLTVQGNGPKPYLVISETAFSSLRSDQLSSLRKFVEVLPISVPTIELCGGGSVRCMMAEVFLPRTA